MIVTLPGHIFLQLKKLKTLYIFVVLVAMLDSYYTSAHCLCIDAPQIFRVRGSRLTLNTCAACLLRSSFRIRLDSNFPIAMNKKVCAMNLWIIHHCTFWVVDVLYKPYRLAKIHQLQRRNCMTGREVKFLTIQTDHGYLRSTRLSCHIQFGEID